MSAVNVVAELQQLWWSRPQADAVPAVVAAWYVHKARVLQRLAGQGSPLAERHASAAYRHAQALMAGIPDTSAPAALLRNHWDTTGTATCQAQDALF